MVLPQSLDLAPKGSTSKTDTGMHYGLPAILLATSACVPNAAALGVTPAAPRCDLADAYKDAPSADTICTMFTDAVARAGRNDIARVEITAPTPSKAMATAFDAQGEALATLEFDVMDTRLDPQLWQRFAASFADYLKQAR